MPPIAGIDDVWARLVSGLVLAGVPDATRGGVRPTPEGQLNVENLLQPASAGEGVLVEFPGLEERDAPEYAYTVRLVRAPGVGGFGIEARCAETLFHHVWPASNPEGLAPVLMQALRAHHAAFLDWHRRGGQPSYAERMGVPALPTDPPDLALVRFLGGLYREGRGLADGPDKGWWAPTTAAWSGAITTGLGLDPTYQLGPKKVQLTEEEQEQVERMERVGWAAAIYGGVTAVFLVGFFGWQVWQWWLREAVPWWGLAGVVGSAISAGLWLVAAQALVRGRSRWFFKDPQWTKWLVVACAGWGMIPCAGWCCLGGLPLGAWVLWVVSDERTARVW